MWSVGPVKKTEGLVSSCLVMAWMGFSNFTFIYRMWCIMLLVVVWLIGYSSTRFRLWRLEPIKAVRSVVHSGQVAGRTLGHREPIMLAFPCLSLVCRRKLEYLVTTCTGSRWTWKLLKAGRFKPRSILLWGNSGNYRTILIMSKFCESVL